ncbi:hypothetical protein BGZ60DRAFT_558885 [Tricladium varicosporioides]|nr:hypothetical protein BGZ60DRAFT_558885 [Hymenoscyphus varicosporioides]
MSISISSTNQSSIKMASAGTPMESIIEEVLPGVESERKDNQDKRKQAVTSVKEVNDSGDLRIGIGLGLGFSDGDSAGVFKESAIESGTTTPARSSSRPPLSRSLSKSKSLTAAEMVQDVIGQGDIDKIAEKLKEEPPLSLEQARKRRASIKEERKKSIDFIRSRTSSRAGAMGQPELEDSRGT